MKPAALLYLSTIDYLREVAKEMGYALAVHGSLARDLDLLACPWTEYAAPADALVEAIRIKLELITGEKWYCRHDDPGHKPHGRLAWVIVPVFGGSLFVDLSVMPIAVPKMSNANSLLGPVAAPVEVDTMNFGWRDLSEGGGA